LKKSDFFFGADLIDLIRLPLQKANQKGGGHKKKNKQKK